MARVVCAQLIDQSKSSISKNLRNVSCILRRIDYPKSSTLINLFGLHHHRSQSMQNIYLLSAQIVTTTTTTNDDNTARRRRRRSCVFKNKLQYWGQWRVGRRSWVQTSPIHSHSPQWHLVNL